MSVVKYGTNFKQAIFCTVRLHGVEVREFVRLAVLCTNYEVFQSRFNRSVSLESPSMTTKTYFKNLQDLLYVLQVYP